MTGEKLGVGHQPRHGTACVTSWIKALENDPREIRAAVVDPQRMSDWLLERERDRTRVEDRAEPTRPDSVEPAPAPPQREAEAAAPREPSPDAHNAPRPQVELSR